MADEPNSTNAPSAAPQEPQTYSNDYVSALRRESAGYRTRATAAEKAARDAFGLKPDEELGDLAARLAAREAKALEKANTRLITAEIRSLSGYDTPLLERLIDRGGITVNDDGTVKGVKEAAEAVAKQFAAVVKAAPGGQWAPKNPIAGAAGTNENQLINDLIRGNA